MGRTGSAAHDLQRIARDVEWLAQDYALPARSHAETERRIEQGEQLAARLRLIVRGG
ncbi:hypothetical protein M9978_16555 [Sphingomonas sp. MG17]|uniref:Uncharacterized protein n=1 Tax=Sphingomonas tagetis TaxID=2949092 RepID=A0A9X2HJK3_9SPHN|nr:hypothetical protein [Sphingomonas tagetis]MCP3732038.1 hypothetical protein [Sphingomonas tagetis]